jgi:hypothetical protein
VKNQKCEDKFMSEDYVKKMETIKVYESGDKDYCKLENVFKKNKEKDDVLSHRQMDEIMGA